MTVFSPVAAAFLSQYARLEARYVQGQASQLAVSSTGLWLRQGDAEHQSVIHALRVADQGVHLEEVTVFSYNGLDRFAGRIDAATADLEPGRWRLSDAWISGADGLPQHHPMHDLPTELTPAQIQESFASPDTISFWDLPRFIANAEDAGFSALRHRLYWYSLLALPLLFSAMVFMAASFSFRFSRLGGVPQLVLAAVLSGFGVYFLDTMTEALGRSGILPYPACRNCAVSGGDPARHDPAFSRGRRVKRPRGKRGRHRYFRTAGAATALTAVAWAAGASLDAAYAADIAPPQQNSAEGRRNHLRLQRAHRYRARPRRDLRPGPHAAGRSGQL